MRIRLTATAVAVLALVGRSGAAEIPAETKVALEKAAEWELYSLDPAEGEGVKDGFHGWKVLGKTTVKDADTRKRLLAALDKGASDSDGTGLRCFEPRHGIRVKAGDTTTDLVICFHCRQAEVYTGGKRSGGYLTAGSPQLVLDKVLTDAKVPLPGKDR